MCDTKRHHPGHSCNEEPQGSAQCLLIFHLPLDATIFGKNRQKKLYVIKIYYFYSVEEAENPLKSRHNNNPSKIMARECKAGNWLFRINPSNDKELQRATIGSSCYSLLWTAPNGERILDINPNGEDVDIQTDRHNYVRLKSGGVKLK